MNKLSAVSLSVLFMILLTLGLTPNVSARIVWTNQPPFPDADANAWLGAHWPERATWWARASADKTTGVMEANIHSYMDVAGYQNVFFETEMIDYVSVATGTFYISGVVFLKGHAHIYGICFSTGGYTVAYSLELKLIVDDITTGTNVLNWKVNEWEDSETGVVGWLTDRGFDFDWDYSIPQTSISADEGHTYKVSVKLEGWVGATTVGLAAAQSDIDFETGDYQIKLKWITYDAPGVTLTIDAVGGGTTDPSPGTYVYTEPTSQEVTAIPNSGYYFTYWTLDWTEFIWENPITVTMTESHELRAHFAQSGGGGGCVAEGTLVTMADGSVKAVEKIKVGDQVLGFDPTTGSYTTENVLAVTKTKAELIENINNGALRLTPTDQPIYIRNSTYEGWVQHPATIKVGWEIFDAETGTWVTVTSIAYEEAQTWVYDFTTDGYQTYLANSYLLMDKGGRRK